MDLTLGPEETAVRDAIRGVLAERLPLARVRAVAQTEPGIDEALWREAGGLGWFGLGLPEAAGGAGYGAAEEMLLFVELGRGLTPGPWLGTVVAAHALAAGAFLVLGSGAARYLPAATHGLAVEGRPSIDPTRRLGDVRFSGIAAPPLAGDAATLRTLATLLAAAEAVGVAERTLEDSVEYAKVRQQFGRPIGSFQAVKHRSADMAVRVEVARSLTTFAAVALAEGEETAPRHVVAAKVLATDAALANAADNVQNHGGMGFTWEADAHLYLKRAWLLEHALGTRAAHLDALAIPWRAE